MTSITAEVCKQRIFDYLYSGLFRNALIEIANVILFAGRFFKELVRPPFELKETIKQAYDIGFKSLPLVSVTAFVMGIVLVLQSRPALVEFGAGSYVPAMAAVSIIREIGPMITGMVCAGNIGSNISAELGSMRVTEQIDAMEVSGTNPFKYLVVTRVLASTLVIPVLVVHSDAVSLVGSFLGANIKDDISLKLFFDEVFEKLTFNDIIPSLAKSYFFGFAIGLVGCYMGFATKNGTVGVGKAANLAVIFSMFCVMLIDMIAAQVSSIFHLLG